MGFYKSVYVDENGVKRSIATSKFQPTYARYKSESLCLFTFNIKIIFFSLLKMIREVPSLNDVTNVMTAAHKIVTMWGWGQTI